MITVCMVLLPGMEDVLECCLESLTKTTSLVSRVLVAVRTQDSLQKTIHYEHITVDYFSFWFDRGPTPAGNTQWRGRGYSHAVGLHRCLEKVETDYILFTEPDVVYLKQGFDQLYINAMEEHELAIVGVTRAADPRGLDFFKQQAIGDFPTVISCLVKRNHLPDSSYLSGKLKLRPHAFPHANTEEESYETLDGYWLLQSCIPDFKKEFPNPEGAYPVGCNLYLFYINDRYLSFHMPQKAEQDQLFNATTFNLNNFGLESNYYGSDPLLYHSGHGGLAKLKLALQSHKDEKPMDKYLRALERTGLSSFEILNSLFEEKDFETKNALYRWARFLYLREIKNTEGISLSDRSDDDIKAKIAATLKSNISMKNNTPLLNEGIYRDIKIYASVECCEDIDCELCGGKNIVYTKKILYPLKDIYDIDNM